MIGTATLSDGPNFTAPVKILSWSTAPWGDRCATVETLPGGTGMWSMAGKQFTVNARLLSDVVEYYTVTGAGRVTIRLGRRGDSWGFDVFNGARHFSSGTACGDVVEEALDAVLECAARFAPSQRARQALVDMASEREIHLGLKDSTS